MKAWWKIWCKTTLFWKTTYLSMWGEDRRYPCDQKLYTGFLISSMTVTNRPQGCGLIASKRSVSVLKHKWSSIFYHVYISLSRSENIKVRWLQSIIVVDYWLLVRLLMPVTNIRTSLWIPEVARLAENHHCTFAQSEELANDLQYPD